MPTWVFRGTVLPDDVEGEVTAGAGEPTRLPGRFALPGLVDAHCHLSVTADDDGPYLGAPRLAEENLAKLARQGVGLVRDVGGERTATLRLGPRDGRPEVQAAGRFFAPEGRYFPRMHEPVPEAGLVAAVHREIDDGARWIKLVADFPLFVDGERVPGSTPEQTYSTAAVAAVVGAAHERGVRVAAHCTTELAAALIAAGVDSIEHGTALTSDDIAALAARGGGWTPTLTAVLGADPAGYSERGRALSNRLSELLPHAIASGVHVMTGSDIVGSVAGEIAKLVEHGVTPEAALRAATTSAREFLGVAGTDLVTYDKDPREDPETLRHPAAVVLRGTRVS
ncbi:amidohydrolase family protein [Labedaea rhizosphaerae]|uniref:Imidazolonepropionase-like amidohydrolase n=1 Tax=Labedaea rhizosphaerae TaxID=598644 RepID=A0A4R6SED3_LABRH|nr:amidohydrolase family protein [Labedaea rhizosphaerae]TDP98013.1 imidazolonepropionase-like amidohydrolase [Labedaea rhizosphaerae]